MKNRDLYFRDPTAIELLNNGVSKVSEIANDERQIRTLRFELETFVCDGEYARGLERILKAYIDGLGREEQKAVWVSGFFGSGKSHLLKMLCHLEELQLKEKAPAQARPTMSAAERQEALSFLKSPKLMKRIARDLEDLGYVGQEREKLLLGMIAHNK
jgi:chromosomal replication initiation ATPase DnaA